MMLCDVAGARPARGLAASVVDPPTVAGEAVAELKAYLRIEGAAEDGVIVRLIAVAIGHGEAFTGCLFLVRPVVETIAAGQGWTRLTWGLVRTIAAPVALAIDGATTPLAVDAYAIDIDAAGDGWVRGGGSGRLRVAYQAGIAADWTSLPDPLRQGAIRLAAHLYSHRDAADEGAPPAAVAALWRPWRRMRLS